MTPPPDEPSMGFDEARMALYGKRWSKEEAEYLHQLVRSGEEGTRVPAMPRFVMRDALMNIQAMLIDVRRYRNMKSFPVTVHLCKKAANRAAEGLGHSLPFPDPYEL